MALLHTLDQWSLRAVPLTLKWRGETLGNATGCFARVGDEAFLITNWHVLSGREPKTGQPIHRDGAVPDFVEYPRFVDHSMLNEVAYSRVNLIAPDDTNLWWQHPVHGQQVDVAAVRIPWLEECPGSRAGQSFIFPVLDDRSNDVPHAWDCRRFDVGDDVFVLGFPLGLKPTGHFPIWKRASIATEMDILLNGKRAFLIDTATREGMSGSPVVHVLGVWNQVVNGNSYHRQVNFMGIYSGRHIGKSEVEAQLGIVWRKAVVREIIVGRKAGCAVLSYRSGRQH